MSYTQPVINLNVNVDCCSRGKPVSVKQSYGSNDRDEWYPKAKKYHNKCWQVIKQMLKEGKRCPQGYEKYLQKFSD